jgi:hypothetical protein
VSVAAKAKQKKKHTPCECLAANTLLQYKKIPGLISSYGFLILDLGFRERKKPTATAKKVNHLRRERWGRDGGIVSSSIANDLPQN